MPRTKQTKKAQQTNGKKRKRGRPATQQNAELIPDTPENIAQAVLNTPPKKTHEWEYLKNKKKE